MFFMLSDVSVLNSMYRFSLAAFLQIFRRALQVEKSKENALAERMEVLSSNLTQVGGVARGMSREKEGLLEHSKLRLVKAMPLYQ